MPHFSRRMESENALLKFYFNQVNAGNETQFHVSVIDKARKLHIFYLRKNGTGWKLFEPNDYPYWIIAMEPVLEKEIIDHLKSMPKGKSG